MAPMGTPATCEQLLCQLLPIIDSYPEKDGIRNGNSSYGEGKFWAEWSEERKYIQRIGWDLLNTSCSRIACSSEDPLDAATT